MLIPVYQSPYPVKNVICYLIYRKKNYSRLKPYKTRLNQKKLDSFTPHELCYLMIVFHHSIRLNALVINSAI